MQISRTRIFTTKCNGISVRDGVVSIQWAIVDEKGAVVEAHAIDGADLSAEATAAVATLQTWADSQIDAAATAKQVTVDAEIAAAIAAKGG